MYLDMERSKWKVGRRDVVLLKTGGGVLYVDICRCTNTQTFLTIYSPQQIVGREWKKMERKKQRGGGASGFLHAIYYYQHSVGQSLS